MPVIVCLRRNFGYSYLRPRSIFLAIAWAFILFTIYAFTEPNIWIRQLPTCIFGIVAILLYLFHLFMAFLSQFWVEQEHDYYSGTPWVHSLLFGFFTSNTGFSLLWLDPAITLAAAIALKMLPLPIGLANYLLAAAFALWLKEAINTWYGIRKTKIQKDILEDAKDQMGKTIQTTKSAPATTTTRKPRIHRKRIKESDPTEEEQT